MTEKGLWDAMHVPDIPEQVVKVAALFGFEPLVLLSHVEGEHGWEPHDEGYDRAVWAAALCHLGGGCGSDVEASP